MSGMTIKHKRRWFQFSLKTVLLGMTIVGVLLSRIAFLQQCATYHEFEAEKREESFARNNKFTRAQVDDLALMVRTFRSSPVVPSYPPAPGEHSFYPPEFDPIVFHQEMAAKYRQAVWRPWTFVKAPPPP